MEIALVFTLWAGLLVAVSLYVLRLKDDIEAMSYAVFEIEKHLVCLDLNIRHLDNSIRAIHEAGPIGCKVCGANHFVQIEDEWLCKECRQPAPEELVHQLSPESRTIN